MLMRHQQLFPSHCCASFRLHVFVCGKQFVCAVPILMPPRRPKRVPARRRLGLRHPAAQDTLGRTSPGVALSWPKLVAIPTQTMPFLGVVVDTDRFAPRPHLDSTANL